MSSHAIREVIVVPIRALSMPSPCHKENAQAQLQQSSLMDMPARHRDTAYVSSLDSPTTKQLPSQASTSFAVSRLELLEFRCELLSVSALNLSVGGQVDIISDDSRASSSYCPVSG